MKKKLSLKQLGFLLEMFTATTFAGPVLDLAYETKQTLEEMKADAEREENKPLS